MQLNMADAESFPEVAQVTSLGKQHRAALRCHQGVVRICSCGGRTGCHSKGIDSGLHGLIKKVTQNPQGAKAAAQKPPPRSSVLQSPRRLAVQISELLRPDWCISEIIQVKPLIFFLATRQIKSREA